MRVIDAVWDKRNLGMDVVEIIMEGKDSVEDLTLQLTQVNVPYVVVKIPSGRVDLLLEAQKYGYQYIETTFHLEGIVSNLSIPSIYKRFEPAIAVMEADNGLKERVLDEIRSGQIFSTDRIALDPAFSKEVAGQRYYNWTCDELKKDARIFIAFYKTEPVAFGISKRMDGLRFDAFLGGAFADASNKGLGFLAIHANNYAVNIQNGKRIVTHVSSNNPAILRLHMEYGYNVTQMEYVLIKHQEG